MTHASGMGRSRRALVAISCVLGAVAVVAPPAGAAGPGSRLAAPTRLLAPPADDPAAVGPDTVDELSYDLGDEAFVPDDLGVAVEIRAKVYAPETIVGRAPLVVLLHGRHLTCASATEGRLDWPCPAAIPEVPSYAGYDSLGRLLASHGMVVVSVGANGINAFDNFVADGGAAARGQLLLQHLALWRGWDASADGSPFGDRFVGHVDLTDVGLMGHSRGGEGVVMAALQNQRLGAPYGIRAVEALAPVDFGRQVLGAVPLGVILPYCDGDVFDLQGARFYDDARYANPGDTAPKQTTLLWGANHNFFNSVWTTGPGSFDDASFGGDDTPEDDPLNGCAPGGLGRLTAADQDRAGAALMAGFFRRYLLDDLGMQRLVTGTAPFPPSVAPARWATAFHAPDRFDIERFDTPEGLVRNRAGGASTINGLSTATVCRGDSPEFMFDRARARATEERCESSGALVLANAAGALDAGWVRPGGSVVEELGGDVDATSFDGLRFRVAAVGDSRNDTRTVQDLTVTLVDGHGARASAQARTFTNALSRIPPSSPRHAVLNGVRIPLSAFAGIDLTALHAVELRFDRTNAGRLLIDDLALTNEGVGDAVGPTTAVPTYPAVRPICRRSAANRWGCAVTQALWGRDPAQSDLAWLAQGYASAAGRTAAIRRAVLASAAAEVDATRFVQRYTGAEVSGGNAIGMVSRDARRSWEAARVDLAEVLAFSTARLSTPSAVVDATYLAFTGRLPDAAGRAYWVPRVEQRGPGDLARALVTTERARALAVADRYALILGRAPDPAGRAYWTEHIGGVDGERRMVRELLDTESFRQAASS